MSDMAQNTDIADIAKNLSHDIGHNTGTLYQHGTLALLVPGLLDGTITMGELLQHGDTGIGTGEGIDGEVVILNGTAYQIRHDGQVLEVPGDFTLPFANAHFADFASISTLDDRSPGQFTDWLLQATGWANTFFAVLATGSFSHMRTRAVPKQHRPYPTLREAAANQHIFSEDVTRGTLLAYYAPQLFNGAAVGGFHIHYLADDHAIGGHVLDFHLDHAEISVQRFDTLEQHLPVSSKAYLVHDFSKDDIEGAISAAE